MKHAQGSTNLTLCMSQAPADAAEQQCKNTTEAHVEAAVRTPVGELPGAACAPAQHTTDGWRWTTAPLAAVGTVSGRSGGNCPAAAVSTVELSKANDTGSAELLHAEQPGSTAAQSGRQGLQFSSSSGAASTEEWCLPQPSTATSGAPQGSTVSPRDFLSPPPAGGGVGLPLWSANTPTAATVAVGSDGRGPAFCRPLQSPSLCGVISVQQLGGIPLLPAGVCELASPSMGGIQQSNGTSPDGDNIQKKFFFSAPFMTPPDPSSAATSGLSSSFAPVLAAQSRSTAGSPTGAEASVVATTGNVVAAAAGETYAEKCQIEGLACAVSGSDNAAPDSLFLQSQTRPALAHPMLEAAATAAAEARVTGGTGGRTGGVGPPTDAAAAAATLSRARALNARAANLPAAAAASNAAASRGDRLQRGVRPAAKSAVLRCNKRSGTGAAAVVTAAVARNSLFKAAHQKANAGTVAPAVDTGTVAADMQDSLLSLQVQLAAAAPQDPPKAAVLEGFAAGAPSQKSAAAEAAATKEAIEKATLGFYYPAAVPADVASSAGTGDATSGSAAGSTAAAEGKEDRLVSQTAATEPEAIQAEGDASKIAGSGVLASELSQQQRIALTSAGEALLPKKKNSAKGVPCAAPAAASAPAAADSVKKFNTARLCSRDGTSTYAATHRLHPRASHQYLKSRSRTVERTPSASAHRLQAMRRLRTQGGRVSRVSAAGVSTYAGTAGRNNSTGRRCRQLKGKKTLARRRCLQDTSRQLPPSSCNKLRRRRPSTGVAAAAAGEKDRSDPAGASADTCAAPLASALCEIGDVTEAEGGPAEALPAQAATTAAHFNAAATPPASPSSFRSLQPGGSSSRRHCSRAGVDTTTAAHPLLAPQREGMQQYPHQAFFRRSGTGGGSSHRGGARAGSSATSPSCSGGAAGSLSERVRAIVEKAMMSKHKIVWIERSEAKGFLPLPGLQEEKVYLVWTEKGIDVLVDLQAYIPWTHCPILMPAKQRRLHIPLLILSSTSLSLLFSHVCRRTATSVYRLPLTRTPPAYRRSMLQMLRGDKMEQRQQPEDEPRLQQTAVLRGITQQQQQGEQEEADDCDAQALKKGERWGCRGPPCKARATKGSGSSSRDSVRAGRMPGSSCGLGGEHHEESGGGAPQSFSPCSTSTGSTGPSSVPSPPATDNADTATAGAATSRAASYVCAAGGELRTVVREGAPKATTGNQQVNSTGMQEQQQQKDQKEGGQPQSCMKGCERYQDSSSTSEETYRGLSCTAVGAAPPMKDAANLPVAAHYNSGYSGVAPNVDSTTEKSETLQNCEGHSTNMDGGMKETGAAVAVPVDMTAGAVAERKDEESSEVKVLCKFGISGGRSLVKTESSLKPRGVPERAHNQGTVDTSAALPSPKRDKSAATGGRANAAADSANMESCKKKVVLDMKDFYSCSQGKVVGEDYVYFRQMLPDDEGADVYDISVNVKKRPKKTFFRKTRLPALWSMLAKQQQQLQQDGISSGATDGQALGRIGRTGESTDTQGSAWVNCCATQEGVESSVRTATAEPPAGAAPAEILSATAANMGDAATATLEITTEELLRLLAQPEESADAPGAWEATAARSDDATEEEDEKKQAWKGSKWAYVEEYGDEGVDERLYVPLVFFSEMRVLLGLAASPTPHRCNMSLASHRVSGAVQRRVRMFLCDGENRGQEIEVYAEGSLASAAGPNPSNKTVEQHPKESNTAGEGTPAPVSERKPDRTGERIEKPKLSEYDRLARRKRFQEKDCGGGVRMPTEEMDACTISTEAHEKGTLGKGCAEGVCAEGRPPEVGSGQEGEGPASKGAPEEKAKSAAEGGDSNGEQEGAEGEEALPDSVTAAEDGTLVEVEFPTEFVQYREADRIRLYGRSFVTRSLQILADVSGLCRGADLSAVNLAQYAPNLFWNVVRFSNRREDLDEVLKELCPAVATLRRRRKRLDGGGDTRARKVARESCESTSLQQGTLLNEACNPTVLSVECTNARSLGSKAITSPPDSRGESTQSSCNSTALAATYGSRLASGAVGPHARQLQREERRQKELELRFQEMKIEFDERARRIMARKDALKNDIFSEVKWSKKSRLPAVPENDDDALINAVIDPEEGILKWPLSAMTVRQKNVIYQACLKRDLTACICLTRVPGKGRAVFAADRILKDDFVVEYKGELCSEREAREREQKYNRSKVPMGSFMFYFKNGSRMMAIDATDEKQDFGPARLINHSRRNPNMTPRAILLNESHGEPRLIFVARRNIEKALHHILEPVESAAGYSELRKVQCYKDELIFLWENASVWCSTVTEVKNFSLTMVKEIQKLYESILGLTTESKIDSVDLERGFDVCLDAMNFQKEVVLPHILQNRAFETHLKSCLNDVTRLSLLVASFERQTCLQVP